MTLSSSIVVLQLYTNPRHKVLQLLVLLKLNSLQPFCMAKIALYLCSILEELGLGCTEATKIYEDSTSTIMNVSSQVPTECACHISVQYFAIEDWKEWGCIELIHIPGVINPVNDLTKPLGQVLHSHHYRRFMEHYT